ncbi:ATP-binding protein [Bacillus suaedaesalsae]|uniref:histidine kinase n=1 Tax=Bacillus suaedaesalsae TaxID=2810349 RepID=A0ABS2DF48_9BACI|nr:ATP-binding protein [Bacillus suaedaesalsae]MBM6616650.1 two-component sensor histidine kinase [Bacillus suaedaesalsae]
MMNLTEDFFLLFILGCTFLCLNLLNCKPNSLKLAAGVAHEIRNPMTSIKGFFQLFQEGVIEQKYFDTVINEFKRIEEIISGLINLTKPQHIGVRNVEVQEILNDVNVLIESEKNLHNIPIIQQFEGGIPKVNCDPNQMKQVLLNLMKNSMEALPNGGEIHASLSATGDEVLITVSENGIGMSEDRVQRLGEPFYSNKEKGTGLGLMLCFRIIKHHNGPITINSSESEGTSVKIRLPIQVI